jgi:hypothetical protein
MRWRAMAASLLLGGAGAGFILRPLAEASEPQRIGTGILFGVAAFSMLRKSPLAQVFARGVAWSFVLPLVAIEVIAGGFVPALAWSATVGAALLALVVSRPLLHTPEATRAFDPVRFRSPLLACATASIAIAIAMAQLGWAFQSVGLASIGIPAIALAASLGLAGFGLVRMRAWGMLLGIATALAGAAAAFFMRHDFGVAIVMPAMIPGAMMLGVLGLSRLDWPEEKSARVPGSVRLPREEPTAARVRVSVRVCDDGEGQTEVRPADRALRLE